MKYYDNELDQLRYEDCLNDYHMAPEEEYEPIPRDPDIIEDDDEDEEEEFVE